MIGFLPRAIRDRLPRLVPVEVTDTIRTELHRGITTPQLIERAERRWWNHGYESDAESASGPGILRPVGAAIALLRAGNCSSPRCDDGRDLDTGDLCRTCEREAEDRRASQEQPIQGVFLTSVPAAPSDHATAAQTPAQRRPKHWKPLRNCNGCDRAHRAAEPGELCPGCRRDGRTVSTG